MVSWAPAIDGSSIYTEQMG